MFRFVLLSCSCSESDSELTTISSFAGAPEALVLLPSPPLQRKYSIIILTIISATLIQLWEKLSVLLIWRGLLIFPRAVYYCSNL